MDSISSSDAKIITSNLHVYQWNQTYIAGTIMLEFKEKLLTHLLDKLNVLNAGYILSSPLFDNLSLYDNYYDFKYEIHDHYITSLSKNESLSFEFNTTNPFIPTDTYLICDSVLCS